MAAPKPLPVLSVSVVAAQQKSIDDDIRVIGTVVPRENVVVMSELSGLCVRAVYADVGDYVKKGQPIAVLDGESLSIDTQGLQTEFERTRDEYDRIKEMLAMGIVSKEFGRQRQAAFEVARAKLRASQLQVNRTQIVALTDGLIYERTATIGGLDERDRSDVPDRARRQGRDGGERARGIRAAAQAVDGGRG